MLHLMNALFSIIVNSISYGNNLAWCSSNHPLIFIYTAARMVILFKIKP